MGAYFPIKNEISLLPFMQWLNEKNIQCALPKIIHYEKRDMIFVYYAPSEQMKQNPLGIFEPVSMDEIKPDILIVPALAIDLSGTRIGYGHGYYDRYISKRRSIDKTIVVIGVCFEQQISRAPLPKEQHDQGLDFVVTERKIYLCN